MAAESNAVEQLPRFLRPTESAANLAVVRIIGCTAALLWSRPDRLIERATLDAPRIPPTLTGDLLLSLPRPDALVVGAAIALTTTLVCGLVGWRTRSALIVASALTWYLGGLAQSYGKVDHNHHLLWILVILAVSPCADALSIDARARSRPPDRSAYGFPVRAIWLVIGLAYFSAGMWKLGSIGLDWIFTDNLRNIIWNERLARGGYEPLLDITGFPLLYKSGAAAAVLFEFSFVVLVFTLARPFIAVAGICFHMATWATMGISFLSLVVLYGVFFDWSRTVERFEAAWRRLGGAEKRAERSAPPRPLSGTLAIAVPLSLILLVALAGATRELNGWPIASYPDFGYRAPDQQATVSLLAGSRPLWMPDLGAIEQHRLLLRAHTDAQELDALRAAVRASGLCAGLPVGQALTIRVQSHQVTDDGLEPIESPPDVLVLECESNDVG